ncbi:MAG: peptide deformylase [Pricia sp.]|nr:peptide deformylase [Pricia sp.]
MPVLEVIKMGNPLLRNLSNNVSSKRIISEGFQNFIDDLIETMRSADGAGIAAPQVGISDRVFVMEMRNNQRYPDKENFPLRIVVNPEIKPLFTEQLDSWEGCLSIPGIRGRLKRYHKIQLKGLDRNGEKFETELSGFAAIVAQHELEHLNGILFVDRMDSMHPLTFQDEYEKYWKV